MSRQVLIDTQALLWFRMNHADVPRLAKREFLDTKNQLFLSLVSVWELAIKISLGKLEIIGKLKAFVDSAQQDLGIALLPIRLEHALRVEQLPFHHRDPFDRILAAQALEDKMKLLSSDEVFDKYAVTRIWD